MREKFIPKWTTKKKQTIMIDKIGSVKQNNSKDILTHVI